MKAHYTKALIDLIKSGKDITEIFIGLKKVLESKGHARLYVGILKDVLRKLSSKDISKAMVTVVSKESFEKSKNAINEVLKNLDAKESQLQIDPTITGGFIVDYQHKRIDSSYKTKLVQLYRSLTK